MGIGAAAGVMAAASLLFVRKAAAITKIGKGHTLKHRALDLAAGAMQPKHPLDAMSTYLNGFHMYADDMGRQVDLMPGTPILRSHAAFSRRQSVGTDSGTDIWPARTARSPSPRFPR
ncbi:hypothetical protein [Streptomyces sp. NPDC004629]|uniref:hypothetical protein n=1 Tax=Streptomyces sp. NPDC004629 TaxID=3364705 RepID=UPI003693AC8F